MPLLALKRFRSYISKKYFYTFGVKSASHTFRILFLSLISICFISYPILFPSFTLDNSKNIDAHLWQHSPHLQSSVAMATHDSPSFIAKQVRVATAATVTPDNNISTISKELLSASLSIYQALTISNKLRDICATTQHRQCIIHSPFAIWNYDQYTIQQDTDIAATLNRHLHDLSKPTGLSLHPYATMGKVSLDEKGNFVSADSIIMTFILKNTTRSQIIWNELLQNTIRQFPTVYTNILDVEPCLVQFKLKLLPATSYSPVRLATTLLFSMGLFVTVRIQFSKSTLLKSASGLGIAALFSAVACYTTTMGIFYHSLCTTIYIVPWPLKMLACCTATLEHVLFLTSAVVSKDKDISTKERIGRGLQQVGVTMTTTLFSELFVLAIGSTLNTPNVVAFCTFTSVALIVSYILNLTLFTAVLSIDIKRAELADLGNEEFEKRDGIHVASHTRFHSSHKSKTRRALNAFFLCVVMLVLNFLSPETTQQPQKVLSTSNLATQTQWNKMSTQFWETLNPTYQHQHLEIHAPQIMIVSPDHNSSQSLASQQQTFNQLEAYYHSKFAALRQLMIQRSKEYSMFDSLHPYLLLAYSVNIPSIILLFILIGIMMWMTPIIREQFMLPFLRKLFVRIVTYILRILSAITPIKTDVLIKKVENEYNEDGMHLGAISLQSRFNMLQNQNNVRNISVNTLTGMHVADIRAMHVSGNLIASIGQQDGKIVLWNRSRNEWIARLDKLRRLEGSGFNGWVAAERNHRHHNPHRILSSRQQHTRRHHVQYLPRARCIQIDQDEKLVAAGFERGLICLWNAETAHLIGKLAIHQDQPCGPTIEDRVTHVLFIELTTRHDASVFNSKKPPHHPSAPIHSEKHLLSVHKNGQLREWSIKTGDMTQCISSGHTREITQILSIPNNQQKANIGTFYIITASKDGTTKCWLRTPHLWTLLYTLNYHSQITSIAAQQLHNGMGILVTGSSDGAVQVWNLDSGAALCILSKGGIISKKISTAVDAEVGGPLLQFSTVAQSTATTDDNNNNNNSGHSNNNNNQKPPAYSSYRQPHHLVTFDHADAVSQVVVTRISNPEFEHDTCPDCNTVVNSGFLVASCALDGSVHVWRLNRVGLCNDETGCTLCAKDYHHRQQQKQQRPLYSARIRSVNAFGPKQRKMHTNNSTIYSTSGEESEGGSVGQQQKELALSALFLGKLNQESCRGLVFCDNMVLAGCRRRYPSRRFSNGITNDDHDGDWEAWFSYLRYYEPPPLDQDATLIPVITFNLEKQTISDTHQQHETFSSKQQQQQQQLNLRDQFLLRVFGIKKVRHTANRPNTAVSRRNAKPKLNLTSSTTYLHGDLNGMNTLFDFNLKNDILLQDDSDKDDNEDDDNEDDDDDDDEAFHALPFSTIRCVEPINGHGLSCDYGNFIKIVTFGENDNDNDSGT